MNVISRMLVKIGGREGNEGGWAKKEAGPLPYFVNNKVEKKGI